MFGLIRMIVMSGVLMTVYLNPFPVPVLVILMGLILMSPMDVKFLKTVRAVEDSVYEERVTHTLVIRKIARASFSTTLQLLSILLSALLLRRYSLKVREDQDREYLKWCIGQHIGCTCIE